MTKTIDGADTAAGRAVTPAAPPAAAATKGSRGLRDKGAWRVLQPAGRPVPFYIAYPADDDQLAAILKGDRPAFEDRKMRRVYAGEIATDVPAGSVSALLERGQICKADGPDDPYAKPAKEGDA